MPNSQHTRPTSKHFRGRWTKGLACALVMLAAFVAGVRAQGTLQARYSGSLAGIPIAKGALTIEIDKDRYSAKGDGRIVGLLRIIGQGGNGWVSGRGRFAAVRALPAEFEQQVNAKHSSHLRMAFASGAVAEITSDPVIRIGSDRVPVTEAHRHGVLDPLGAILVVAPGTKDPVAPETCARTIPVFDGHQRFDLTLSFKRIEQPRGETGYRGPLLVCRVDYRPIAGHNAKSWAVKYLTERTDVEVALAPIAGTRVLVPYRASFPTWYGTAVVQATQFDTAISAARAGAAADDKVR